MNQKSPSKPAAWVQADRSPVPSEPAVPVLTHRSGVHPLPWSRTDGWFEPLPDAWLLTDTLGKINDCNQAAEGLFERPRRFLLGKPLTIFIAVSERPAFRRVLSGFCTGRHFLIRDWKVPLQPSGRPRGASLLAASVVAVRDRAGTVLNLRWQLRDLSKVAAVDEALRMNERVLESMSEGVLVADISGQIRFTNAALDAMYGYDRGELIGASLTALTVSPLGDPHAERLLFESLQAHERWQGEFRSRKKDGSVLVTTARVTAFVAGDTRYLVAVHEDMTERQRAEQARRQSEERFALAVAGTNDGVWDWDLPGNTVYLSPRCDEILGYAAGKLPRDVSAWMARIHPDDHDRISTAFTQHVLGQTPHLQIEYRVQDRNGGWSWVLVRGLLQRDAQGSPYRMAGSLTDITAQKRAQEQLRQRESELAYVNRLNTMGEMASGLAHEINQPLAAIANYAKGAALRIQGGVGPPEDILGALDKIAAQALRAGDIIRRMRSFIRRGEPQRSPVHLADIAQEVAAMIDGDVRAAGTVLHVDVPMTVPSVSADPVQLEQVLLNLVRNGMEAMTDTDANGRALTIRATLCDDRHHVQLIVSDSGVGLPAEHAAHLFDAFFTTKPKGLGMGLSISRSIVEAHGGRLWATVNPDHGSTFHVLLPVADAAGNVDPAAIAISNDAHPSNSQAPRG